MSEHTYFAEPQLDRMAALVWQLAQELYVTRRRVRALEQVLVDSGSLPEGAVDRHRPDGPAGERESADRDAYLQRLLRTISERDDHRTPTREQFQQQLDEAESGRAR